jgi:3-(3-hydroxy-phenyl)propionate hydroxylase
MLEGELALEGSKSPLSSVATARNSPARVRVLHSRTIEVFDQRGIGDRFLSEGQVAQVAGFAGTG